MTFRPYPVLTIAAVIAVGALIWLGYWQLQRADWKRGLIAAHNARSEAVSLSWSAGVCPYLSGLGDQSAAPISSDAVAAQVDAASGGAEAFRVFGRSVAGQVGWRVFLPLDTASCGAETDRVLVQTAFVAEEIGPSGVAIEPEEVRYVVEPWPARPAMAAANAPESNQWYWLDHDRIAAMDEGDLNGAIIVTPFAGKPDHLIRTPPVRHISYAVTWFGLALCLVIVYGVAHAKAGRLSFHGQGKSPEA